MNPATIALIIAAIGEASKYILQLAELSRRAQAGELDDATVLLEYQRMQAEYRAGRAEWDDAGAPPPGTPT